MPNTRLTIVVPDGAVSNRMDQLLNRIQKKQPVQIQYGIDHPLPRQRILFAASLDSSGVNLELCRILQTLRQQSDCLSGSVGGVLIDGAGDLYTKSVGRTLVQAANQSGCAFPGRPLVEATGDLHNFAVQAQNGNCSLEEACFRAAEDLSARIVSFERPRPVQPRILALHASNYQTSNTMALWHALRARLPEQWEITEIGLRNGALEDCSGCPYTTCLHFGEAGSCFYGGVIVQSVYPAIREADAVVLLCPNYNDAPPANLSACINRLTALYRTTSFERKALFGIVVSGYSGGDIVARQLVSALCMNKGFWLPPRFCLLETANNAGAALRLPEIETRLDTFARQMREQLEP